MIKISSINFIRSIINSGKKIVFLKIHKINIHCIYINLYIYMHTYNFFSKNNLRNYFIQILFVINIS